MKKSKKTNETDQQLELLAFWERLQKVRQLHYTVKTHQLEDKPLRIGRATVDVVQNTPSAFVFQEKGHWVIDDLPETSFSNSFRWTLDRKASLITLEHLRYGMEHPVFLLQLCLAGTGILESINAHLCGEDTYLGNIRWSDDRIDFHWRVIGPRKNDDLSYHYS
jgi:hypothetical protein